MFPVGPTTPSNPEGGTGLFLRPFLANTPYYIFPAFDCGGMNNHVKHDGKEELIE